MRRPRGGRSQSCDTRGASSLERDPLERRPQSPRERAMTTSDQSRPYAPAFILTPPPTVPGIAHANSKPPSSASRARCRQTALAAPPPATIPRSRALRPRPARPRVESRARPHRRLRRGRSSRDPRPRPRARGRVANRSASSSSASERGRASAFAGPPVPIVVSFESETPVSMFTRAGPRRPRARSSTAPPPRT